MVKRQVNENEASDHRRELNLTKYLQNSFSKSSCLNDKTYGFNKARLDAMTDDKLGPLADEVVGTALPLVTGFA